MYKGNYIKELRVDEKRICIMKINYYDEKDNFINKLHFNNKILKLKKNR